MVKAISLILLLAACTKKPVIKNTTKDQLLQYVNDFMVNDKNHDNKVTKDENEQFVKQFDKNKDGVVNLEEVLDFIYNYQLNTED